MVESWLSKALADVALAKELNVVETSPEPATTGMATGELPDFTGVEMDVVAVVDAEACVVAGVPPVAVAVAGRAIPVAAAEF